MQHSMQHLLFPFIYWSNFRELFESMTATKMKILHFWNDFSKLILSNRIKRGWSHGGADVLMNWACVFIPSTLWLSRTHHYLFTVIQRWGEKSRWYLNTVLKMQNKYLTIKFFRNYRWSSNLSCVHILEIIKMKSGSLSLKTWIINIWTSACSVLISADETHEGRFQQW